MSDFFSAAELAQLREHGIVIYANRVIFDAQPPMSAEQMAAIQAQCAGPLPAALAQLWQTTAGGALDYDLSLPMNGGEEAISWCELFWNGSEGYNDLQGWIDHEKEIADETAGSGDALLRALPFGGFEYTDRIYTVVEPGPQHGHVLAWKQGLPQAWAHAMHEDGLATIATDLPGAFAALHLNEDPREPTDDYFTGQALLDYVDERHGDHDLPLELADKLIAFYCRALLDWRTSLEQGTLAQSPLLTQAALRHAIATDDTILVARLAAAGLRFDAPLQGRAVATDLALGQGAYAATQALIEAGAPVQADAMDAIEGPISAELALALLARGAQPSTAAIAQCVACGAPDAARLIAQAYARQHPDPAGDFDKARTALLTQLAAAADEVREGRLEHHLGLDGLIERIENLQNFEL